MHKSIRAVSCLLFLLAPIQAAVAPWPTTGWATSTPEDQGIDSAQLQAADAYIRNQCPSRYSFLVIRNGYVVFERYYHGMSQSAYADVMSDSKSVLSLMIGQALDAGTIDSLDRTMAGYFPEYFSASTDSRKRQITLRHMLTMTAGLQWDEVATGNSWVGSKDWYKFVIDLPMAANPGDIFDYNTGLSHLLAGVLSRASGQSAYAFGYQNLFAPLGIWNFRWDTDPRGNYVGGFHMYFNSRDLAKFGYLALRKGFWEGRQLVSRTWVDESTSFKVADASPTTTGDYAYHWWVRPQWGYNTFMAAGRGGQYVFVIPGLDLIVVSTADSANDTVDLHLQAFNLLSGFVLPAITSVADRHLPGPPHIDSVASAASFSGNPSPGAWIVIRGSNLSGTTREWTSDDFTGRNLPVQLDNVSVTIGGKPAYVSYISPEQINALVPAGLAAGDATVLVTTAPARHDSTSVTVSDVNPALFLWNAKYAVAQHTDYSLAGPRTLFFGLATTPAKPGETIILYGTGFGDSGVAASVGELARQAISLPSLPDVTIGGIPATVDYAGIPQGGAGLYQINVRVPESVPAGELPVSVSYGGVPAPVAYLAVAR